MAPYQTGRSQYFSHPSYYIYMAFNTLLPGTAPAGTATEGPLLSSLRVRVNCALIWQIYQLDPDGARCPNATSKSLSPYQSRIAGCSDVRWVPPLARGWFSLRRYVYSRTDSGSTRNLGPRWQRQPAKCVKKRGRGGKHDV